VAAKLINTFSSVKHQEFICLLWNGIIRSQIWQRSDK